MLKVWKCLNTQSVTNLMGVFSFDSFFFFLFRAAPAAYGSSQAEVKSELQLLTYTTAIATQDP